MKHSKGRWHKGQGNGEGSIFTDEGRMRWENGTTLYPICSMVTGFDAEEDEANADLIAAAPELLEALAAILPYAQSRAEDMNESGGDDCQLWIEANTAVDAAIAVIAKAKGG